MNPAHLFKRKQWSIWVRLVAINNIPSLVIDWRIIQDSYEEKQEEERRDRTRMGELLKFPNKLKSRTVVEKGKCKKKASWNFPKWGVAIDLGCAHEEKLKSQGKRESQGQGEILWRTWTSCCDSVVSRQPWRQEHRSKCFPRPSKTQLWRDCFRATVWSRSDLPLSATSWRACSSIYKT